MIWFHVGLHKTGSSSIQSALKLIRHRPDLRVVLPGDSQMDSDDSLAGCIDTHPPADQIVISNEGFFGEAIDGYPLVQQRLAFFSEVAGECPWRVLVFIREPMSWLSSIYLQALQEGAAFSARKFWKLSQEEPALNPAALAASLIDQLPEVNLRIGIMSRNHDVVKTFFDIAGLGKPPAVRSGSIRENVSISATQGVLLQRLNSETCATPEEKARYRQFFQSATPESESRLSPFDDEVQLMIHETLGQDWEQLMRRLDQSSVLGKQTLAVTDAKVGERGPHVTDSLEDTHVEREVLRIIRRAALASNMKSPRRPYGGSPVPVKNPAMVVSILSRKVGELFRRLLRTNR